MRNLRHIIFYVNPKILVDFFLKVMLDEKISWKEHIKTFSKNIGLSCKSKQLLDSESLKTI